jgi:ribonucleotide monophosphatase NagD (HAD superfamily)
MFNYFLLTLFCTLSYIIINPIGTGSMVAAVETAAGRKPLVLGKPSPFMFDIVRRRHPAVQPARTLMIGDR